MAEVAEVAEVVEGVEGAEGGEVEEEAQVEECQVKCFILFQLNSEIKLNSIHFNRSFRSFETIESTGDTVLFCPENLSFLHRISVTRSGNI